MSADRHVFAHGVSAGDRGNASPALWARNVTTKRYKQETGKLGEILFFMRAGYTGSQKYSTMMWAV